MHKSIASRFVGLHVVQMWWVRTLVLTHVIGYKPFFYVFYPQCFSDIKFYTTAHNTYSVKIHILTKHALFHISYHLTVQ